MTRQNNNEVNSDSNSELPSSEDIELIVETSWEVCNKIGGIYAVLSTKASCLIDKFGDKMVFIGPDVWTDNNPSPYFKEKKSILKMASYKLKLPYGITIRTGNWLIPGSPQVILVNPGDVAQNLDTIYAEMWEKYGVDSLHAYGDYNESCIFSVAASIVIDHLAKYLKVTESKVVAHFNEWTTGMGLLNTQINMPGAATIFTTHATSIGRSICGNGKPLYDYFHNYNGDQMATELNMQSKHSLEKAAAHAADCFTTVSKVTARECEQLLDINPQVVTPNGFEPDFVPKTNKYHKLQKEGRRKLISIASALTGKKFNEDIFIMATSGRNEYRNKGIDLFLDSIVRMEEMMPENAEALAFILVPAWVKEPAGNLLMTLDFSGTEDSAPDFLTHRLYNEDYDMVCCRIRELRAEGRFSKIHVIYVPSYLDGNDGILNIAYYDLLPAIDLTIFPSYYEPWGYTPMESTAFGVPTVTTDKAGFGQWVLDNFRNGVSQCGVYVVPRSDSNYFDSRENIACAAYEYSQTNPVVRSAARHASFLTAEKANWTFFIHYYNEAFEKALSRSTERNNKK